MSTYPRPNGELQGDDRPIPMNDAAARGGDTFGADVGQGATNSMGSIKGSTGSDPADKCTPIKP